MVHLVAFVVSALCVTSLLAAPAPQVKQQDPEEIQLVRYVNENNGIDPYRYTYELSNGQIVSEAGALKDVPNEEGETVKVIVVSGQYSFVDQDGVTHWVNYTADENGFHPVVGTGPGGIQPGEDAGINPTVLKSLVG